ncbi:MAG: U32 family peptidase [Chloroflexi bacterium]|nr:U32 family peptidase [Chloroflexota bacterium]
MAAQKSKKFCKKKPELVAPAGSLKDLEAAVEEGADAVYIGPAGLSGRPRMAEMSMLQIRRAREITADNGRMLYVAVNAAMPWGEEKFYLDVLKQLCDMGVDALIIGDPAVLTLAVTLENHPRIHASTFLGIYNPQGAAWVKSLGFRRLVLNTGIHPDEIRAITKQVKGLEYEMIAYGPICFNDNHRCNLPHGTRSRSGMKDILKFSPEFTYCQSRIEVKSHDRLINSGRLLCWPITDLSESLIFYMALGVGAFKIAGRERETEYIRTAVRTMRHSIDSLPDELPGMDLYSYNLHISERRPG